MIYGVFISHLSMRRSLFSELIVRDIDSILYEGSWSLLLALDTFDFVAFKPYEILSIFE